MRAVLTFHRIDDGPGPLSYRPQRFRALLETLADGDIPVVDIPSLLDPSTTRGLALTFDDGYKSVHDVALVKAAPWWTLRHSLVVAGILALVLMLAGAWARSVENRNAVREQQYQAILAERIRARARGELGGATRRSQALDARGLGARDLPRHRGPAGPRADAHG